MKLYPLMTLAALTLTASAAVAQYDPYQQPYSQQEPYSQQAYYGNQSYPAPGQPIPRSDPNGAYCREYQQPVVIGGVSRKSYGTACQQPDGTWKILPSDVQQQANANTPPIDYVSPPQYVSAPVYMVPPPVYYQPAPYYGPYPYPYGYGSGFSVGIGFGGGYHGGYHGGYRGGYGGYHHHY